VSGRQRKLSPEFLYLRDSILPPEDVDKILHHNAQIVLGLTH
jgi:predicted TIM-barrel fold metal-dependent hydrolase